MPRRFSIRSTAPGWTSFPLRRTATTALIAAQRRGEAVAPLVERHNAIFAQSYRRWFEAVYKDKYEYLGEYDLMNLAFRMDLGLYYLGIVSQPFKYGAGALASPPFSVPVSTPVYHFMRFYNAPPRRDGAQAPRTARVGPRQLAEAVSFPELFDQPRRTCRASSGPRRNGACWNCGRGGGVGLARGGARRSASRPRKLRRRRRRR